MLISAGPCLKSSRVVEWFGEQTQFHCDMDHDFAGVRRAVILDPMGLSFSVASSLESMILLIIFRFKFAHGISQE
jgi:hypothetical protein